MTRRRLRAVLSGLALAGTSITLLPSTAGATFGGADGKIAYVLRDDNASPGEIFTIKADGSQKQNLTQSPSADDEAPSWSSDGKRIVWARNGEIWRMRADGSHPLRLTQSPQADRDPSFSPSGRRIVWSRGGQIWLMNGDGSSPTSLLMYGEEPNWSPDGHWIAYWRSESGLDTVFKSHPDGTHETALPQSSKDASNPDWSPDGAYIAFTYVNSGSTDPNVAFMSSAGAWGDGTASNGAVNESDGVWEPNFSAPNASHVLFVKSADLATGPSSLWSIIATFAPDNGSRITYSQHLISDPSWQPLP